MAINPQLMIEFVAVAREQSFTRASEQLRVAQPWLSARIRKLEQILGFPLFLRTTRKVTLTERGEVFFKVASGVADTTAQADTLARRLRREVEGRLRIGVAPYTRLISERRDAIALFRTRLPTAGIELQTGWSPFLKQQLKEGHLDLTFMMGEFDNEIFDGILIRKFGISITMSKENVLSSKSYIERSDLSNIKVQVFTRALNTPLWDSMYQSMELEAWQIEEIPDMAEGAPDHLPDPMVVAAFFDFGVDQPPAKTVTSVPYHASINIPFSLLRCRGDTLTPAGSAFWEAVWQVAKVQKCS